MVVIVMTAVPRGLRGDLTKWLVELKPGVFCGRVTRRVREHLWRRVKRSLVNTPGTAHMVWADHGREQGWDVVSAGEDRWLPVDFDGLTLMVRPSAAVADEERRP